MVEGSTEELLVRAARAGDRQAFGRLIEIHRSRVEALVRSRLGSRLRGISGPEDVLQESLLRAFRALERFEWQGEGSFLRWLGTIVEHVVLKLAARAERRQTISLGREPVGSTASAGRQLRRSERLERLEKALATLSPDYQEVLRLSRLEGLRVRDIAARLGRSPKSVSHLLSRALRALRAAFGDTESLSLPAEGFRPVEADDERRDEGDEH